MMDRYIYEEKMNGSEIIQPLLRITGFDSPVKPVLARSLIDAFEDKGYLSFNATGTDLWVILAHCTVRRIPFEMKGQVGAGFTISKQKV